MSELTSYATYLDFCPDEDIQILRELLCYDALNPYSCDFLRVAETGGLVYRCLPSPMHWSRQFEWPWAIREGDFQKGHHVLDIGGGWSVVKYPIATRVNPGVVTTIDLDAEGMKQTALSAEAIANYTGVRNIVLLTGDARKLPYPDSSFDRVLCISMLEHVKEGREKILSEMLRVLRPGGLLLLTMDVCIEGKDLIDFHMDTADAEGLVHSLGIKEIGKKNVDKGYGVLEGGKIKLHILGARYVKP